MMIKAAHGFSLIELMVTLVVLAVLVSMAMPMLDVLDKRRVIGAAEAVYSEFQFAKSEAIKQSRDMRVAVIDSDNSEWCVGVTDKDDCNCTKTDPEQGNACTVTVYDVAGDEAINVLRTVRAEEHTGVTLLDDSGFPIEFDSLRGILNGVDNTVELESEDGVRLDVVVSRMGRIRLCGQNEPVGGYPQCD